MAIKVELNNIDIVDNESYPCIKTSPHGWVVLFAKPGRGTCIVKGKAGYSEVGEYGEDWNEESFTKLNGSITLSNE